MSLSRLQNEPVSPDAAEPAESEAYLPDSKGLGRLRRVTDPRQWRKVWEHEAVDFTPWLAQYINDLGEVLGMVLAVVGTEVPVGEFRLDIQAKDDSDNVVIIENQLERTDHGHLGQCLVYASVLEASTVVWVARQFREDFRRALDWLNERTDERVRFFGVEVGLVRVDDSRLAPDFKLVVRPNDWAKSRPRDGSGGRLPSVTPLNARRQDFFVEVLSDLKTVQSSVRVGRGTTEWVTFASGAFGEWNLVASSQLRIEAYLNKGQHHAKALFDEMVAGRAHWDDVVGLPLSWERLDGKQVCRIAAYHPFDVDDEASRAEGKAWALATADRMLTGLDQELRRRAVAVRSALSDQETGGQPEGARGGGETNEEFPVTRG